MEAYQQRVVDEKTELDSKIAKLSVFTNTPKFKELPTAEQVRMLCQGVFMQQYSNVLGDRIAAFQ